MKTQFSIYHAKKQKAQLFLIVYPNRKKSSLGNTSYKLVLWSCSNFQGLKALSLLSIKSPHNVGNLDSRAQNDVRKHE